MALGLQTGGGGSGGKPFVRYNAQSGRLSLANREQDGSGMWFSNDIDITNDAQFVADLPEVRVGWINFTDRGPVRFLVKLGEPLPPMPDVMGKDGKPAFKQGFVLMLAMPKNLGGGVRELSSTAGCVIDAVSELHDSYKDTSEAKTGKLPVVHLVRTLQIKSGQSTNYKPVFQIVAWVDRPSTLPVDAYLVQTELPGMNGGGKPVPPSTGSTRATPPPSANDFG